MKGQRDGIAIERSHHRPVPQQVGSAEVESRVQGSERRVRVMMLTCSKGKNLLARMERWMQAGVWLR